MERHHRRRPEFERIRASPEPKGTTDRATCSEGYGTPQPIADPSIGPEQHERGRTGGNPFTPAAKSVSADGSVGDGPAGSMASGYSIIKAGSLDEATELAKGCPILQGGARISVFETSDVM